MLELRPPPLDKRTVRPRSLTRMPSSSSWCRIRKHSSAGMPASSISSSVLTPSGLRLRNSVAATAAYRCRAASGRSAAAIRVCASSNVGTRRLAGNTRLLFSLRFRKPLRSSQAIAVVTLVEASRESMSIVVPSLSSSSSLADTTISELFSRRTRLRMALSRPTKSRCVSLRRGGQAELGLDVLLIEQQHAAGGLRRPARRARPPAGSSPASPGCRRGSTTRMSGLSTPMPKALVAAITGRSPSNEALLDAPS